MKTKEELNALKEEVDTLNSKLAELTEEEMIQVAIISVEAVLYGKPYVDAVNEAQGIHVEK